MVALVKSCCVGFLLRLYCLVVWVTVGHLSTVDLQKVQVGGLLGCVCMVECATRLPLQG